MKLNAASRIYLDVSVLPSEQSRADDDADEENDDSTRKKNGGNRICRNRYTGPPNATWPQEMRNPPPPLPPSSSLPCRWISRAFVESMAPLSPLFYRIHVCDPTYEKYHSFVQWFGAGFTCWTVSRRWFFKTNERLLRIEVRLVDYRGQRQEENRKTLSRESRWTYMKNL